MSAMVPAATVILATRSIASTTVSYARSPHVSGFLPLGAHAAAGVVLTTNPHLKTRVNSTPETLFEKKNTLDNGFRPTNLCYKGSIFNTKSILVGLDAISSWALQMLDKETVANKKDT